MKKKKEKDRRKEDKVRERDGKRIFLEKKNDFLNESERSEKKMKNERGENFSEK